MNQADQLGISVNQMYEDLCPSHQAIVDIYVERFREYFANAPRPALLYAAMALDIVLQERLEYLSTSE